MAQPQSFQREIVGRNLVIETGKLAGQAHAAVTVRYGDTVVLVSLCISEQLREGVDFLPLTVDYEERLYAAGKIPGGFIRREGRPSEEATLAARMTDRPLRPLLPKAWRNDIQIVVTVLSADQENDPDILAVIGGSAVLTMSEIPFDGPVGAVHVGYINDQFVLNPTLAQLENSSLDLVVVSSRKAVVMVEAGAKEVQEDLVARGIEFGHKANQDIIELQEQLQQACGKPKKEAPILETNPEAVSAVSSIIAERLEAALYQPSKVEREEALNNLRKEVIEKFKDTISEAQLASAFDTQVKARVRANILEKGQRVSGRGVKEIRPIECEVGLLPRTHGSSLFTRGRTQVLAITTLGSMSKEQKLEGLGIEESKRFIHHYNFPPFSTGEVKRLGTPGRREIGHGALAERALLPMIPREEDFPYTIRVVSEVLSSSGSTSMGSVCAGSLSLMDAGIPVKAAVAGIALGLVTDSSGRYALLTDIEGIEDNYGDMDFKIAGTAGGITALQLDIKLKGVSIEMLEKALYQGKDARMQILEVMNRTINTPRAEVSRYAPQMYKITIDPSKIGAVIGSGGKTIRSITEQTKTTVDIENDGTIIIGAANEEAANKAINIIQALTKDVEVGEIYTGKVTRLLPFGAFVEILPGKEGMVHISELADYHVPNIEDEVKVGDEITVKVIRVEDGKVGLSRKAVFEKPGQRERMPPEQTARPRFSRPPQRTRPPRAGA